MTDISEIIKKINQKIEIPKINNKIHNGKLWVNPKCKKGFLGIPKCASNTIKRLLNLKYTIDIDFPNLNKKIVFFTIMRNPIERYVSAYIEVIQDCKQYPGGRYHHNLGISQEKTNTLDKIINSNNTNIEKFIRFTNLILNKWGFFEPHTTPQINYLAKNNILFKNVKIFKLKEKNKIQKFLKLDLLYSNKCENIKLKKELLNFIKLDNNFKNKLIHLYKSDFLIYNNI